MKLSQIKNITVFGPGMMGSGIAQIFAGCENLKVTIHVRKISNAKDSENINENLHVLNKKGLVKLLSEKEIVTEEVKGLDKINENLQVLREKGLVSEEEIEGILSRISITSDFEEAVKDADLVIECIPEKLELKQDLFARVEKYCKEDTILATNTSVISITEIAEKTINKSRVVGTHFWNPPYLIPLVEVIKSDYTSEEVFNVTYDLLKKIGKKPVKVQKDVPGFLANRLQHALWREAISIVEKGIADAATVDESIKYGFGLRLPVLGPMENSDMVGTDLTLNIHSYILKHLENSTEPSPLLVEKVNNNELGFKSGKGFQEWTEEEMKASSNGLREYLIEVVYK